MYPNGVRRFTSCAALCTPTCVFATFGLMPGHLPLAYPGSTGEKRNGFRQWVFQLLGGIAK